MKFLIDAQLPSGMRVGLQSQGHEAEYVPDLLGQSVSDSAIIALAVTENWIVITKDGDFAAPPMATGLRVVWLRLGNATNRRLVEWLEPRWSEVEAALTSGDMLVEVR